MKEMNEVNKVEQLLKDCKSYLSTKEYEDESGIVSSLLSRIDEELYKEYIFKPSIFNASFLTEEEEKEFINKWLKTKSLFPIVYYKEEEPSIDELNQELDSPQSI
jgi:hypothetical protein